MGPSFDEELTIEGKELALAMARVLEDQRCKDIVVLDVTGMTDVCDYLVIGSGMNRPHMKATLARMEDFAKTVGENMLAAPDMNTERWMVADFVDVVVHLFASEWRDYYDLEMLWGDAPKLDLSEVVSEAAAKA